MELNIAKTICIIALFMSTWFSTCVPYYLIANEASRPRHVLIRNTVLSYLKCFAGGVFMSVCFVGLIPTGMESMQGYFKLIGVDTDFPAFMCVAAVGFFTIASVELIAHSLLHKELSNTTPSGHQYDQNTHENQNGLGNSHAAAVAANGKMAVSHVTGSSNVLLYVNNGDVTRQEFELREVCHKHNDIAILPSNGPETEGASRQKAGVEVSDNLDDFKAVMSVINATPLRAFLLLTAFSFHTVFDGLAVGLGKTEGDVWKMFTAVFIHKSLVSICLGLQLFLHFKKAPSRGVLWSLFFAVISPIGVAIGMALTSKDINKAANLLTNTILQGLAAGTFLFVIFFEILREEMVDKKGFKRVLTVAVGFTTMALFEYFLD